MRCNHVKEKRLSLMRRHVGGYFWGGGGQIMDWIAPWAWACVCPYFIDTNVGPQGPSMFWICFFPTTSWRLQELAQIQHAEALVAELPQPYECSACGSLSWGTLQMNHAAMQNRCDCLVPKITKLIAKWGCPFSCRTDAIKSVNVWFKAWKWLSFHLSPWAYIKQGLLLWLLFL